MPSRFVARPTMHARYAALAATACLGLTVSSTLAQAVDSEPALDMVTVEIPKTTLALELLPVEVSDGKTLLVCRREIDWVLYDTYIFALDQDDKANPDDSGIVTRPTPPYINMDRGWGHVNYPAMGMSHKAAAEFCIWLSHKTGRKFRLPTEDEWQSIAEQSGTTPDDVEARCWHAGNSDEVTHESATKQADALGLFDMLGNVGEWCFTASGKPIVRGGSYLDDPDMLTPDASQKPHRSWNATDPQIPRSKWWLADCTWVGIRPVCEVEDPPESEGTDASG